MDNFSLNHIKIAVFDFDDTLSIHDNKSWAEQRTDDYYIQAYLRPEDFYDSIEPCHPSKKLQEIVQFCRANGIDMYCLSGMRFSLHYKAKETFINEYYGADVKLVSSASQELKADVLHMLAKIHNCSKNEVLFVDDLPTNISSLVELGYWAVNVNCIDDIEIPDFVQSEVSI